LTTIFINGRIRSGEQSSSEPLTVKEMRMSDALSRRGFLGLAGALGASAPAGCGSGQGSAAAAPKTGGRLRAVFGGGGAKEVLDPHVQSLFVDIARHKAMFDKLVELGPELKPIPRLAERWEPDAQTASWRFTLRDATFHDGKPLTSEDVLYSLSRIADPRVPQRVAQSSLASLDLRRCKAIDKRTLELTLSAPNAEFPALLAGIGTQVVRSGYVDPTKPVGTGAFEFVSFEPGRSMVARRYADYWDGAARLEELQILSAATEARANALPGGQAEYANEMTATFARTAEAGRTVKIGKGFQYYPADLPQRERNVEEAKDLLTKGAIGSHRSGAMPIPQYFTDRLLSQSPFNVTHWRQPEFDAAFAAAQVLTDETQRAAKYQELPKTLHDQGGILAWGHPGLGPVRQGVAGLNAVVCRPAGSLGGAPARGAVGSGLHPDGVAARRRGGHALHRDADG
jgi:peptide/nickel transport system substrate-binding protein